jgi:hypothetical protein
MEIALRLEANHTAALRTTIAAQQKACRESIKIGQNEPMSPRPSRLAVRANFRPGPQIITALLINILENDDDRQYHLFTFLGYFTYPYCVRGGEFGENSPPFSIKKASFVRPIYSDNTRLPVNLF